MGDVSRKKMLLPAAEVPRSVTSVEGMRAKLHLLWNIEELRTKFL